MSCWTADTQWEDKQGQRNELHSFGELTALFYITQEKYKRIMVEEKYRNILALYKLCGEICNFQLRFLFRLENKVPVFGTGQNSVFEDFGNTFKNISAVKQPCEFQVQ